MTSPALAARPLPAYVALPVARLATPAADGSKSTVRSANIPHAAVGADRARTPRIAAAGNRPGPVAPATGSAIPPMLGPGRVMQSYCIDKYRCSMTAYHYWPSSQRPGATSLRAASGPHDPAG